MEVQQYCEHLDAFDLDNKREDVVAQEYQQVKKYNEELRKLVLDLDKPVHYALGKLTTSYNDLDFEGLVAMRVAHQTRQAATGVHTQHSQMRNAAKTPETIRNQLIRVRRFHEFYGKDKMKLRSDRLQAQGTLGIS